MAKNKKIKGKAYKSITFDSGNAMAILYSLWQRGNHPDQSTDHSCEFLDTIETFATENVDSDGTVTGLHFPKEDTRMVVSVGLHEYMPAFFKTLSPTGAMSRDFKSIKQAVMDAERVFDKELVEGGWELEDGVWFSPAAIQRPKSEDEAEDKTEGDDAEGEPAEEEDEPAGDDDAGDVSDSPETDEDAA